jgi:hypothetical protein
MCEAVNNMPQAAGFAILIADARASQQTIDVTPLSAAQLAARSAASRTGISESPGVDNAPTIKSDHSYLNRFFGFAFVGWLPAEISVRTSCASLASLSSRRRHVGAIGRLFVNLFHDRRAL